MPTFGNSECAFLAQLGCKLQDFFWELEEVEGFLQRTLGLYTYKFPKCSAASFMDFWSYICVFRNGDAVQQWKCFLQTCVNFLDTYNNK